MATELTPRELTAELAALKSRLADQEALTERALSIASHHAPEHFFEGNDAFRPHIAVRLNSGATEVGRRPRLNFLDTETGEWTLGVGTTEGEDEIDISLKATGGGLGFCYDYLVMSGWTGTEGQTITIPDSTETFKVYSTIGGAITNIESTDAKANYSVGICNGSYAENVSWPTAADVSTVEHISLIGIGGFYEPPGQSTVNQVRIVPSSGAPLSYGSAAPSNGKGGYFENIAFQATSAKAWDYLGGINATMVARDCFFTGGDVELDGTGIEFDRCNFTSSSDLTDVDGTGGIDNLHVKHCWFSSSAINLSAESIGHAGLVISNNEFSNTKIVIGATQNLSITANSFHGFTNLNDVITVSSLSTSEPHAFVIADNVFSGSAPSTGNGCIVIADAGGEQYMITITGNTFNGVATTARDATTAWIKLTGDAGDKVFSVVVANNSFGSSSGQLNTLEDRSGFTVLADYLEQSILGPNAPVGKVKYKVTNGANNLIIPASADDQGPSSSGALPTDGHAILDASSHTDSAADAVTRGSLILANSTPKWDELVIAADHLFLGSNGTDALYRTVGWDVLLEPTGSNDAARIQTVIDAGARKILLLDGSWDVSDATVTFAVGTEIFGQTREATILSWGTVNANAFVLAAGCIAANFTVNTAPTNADQPPIISAAQGLVWNIHFGSSSGNGLQANGGIVAECIFEGVPDASTGQIEINKPARQIIRDCEFAGAAASGAAIFNRHTDTGGATLPPPSILITGCYGFTECAEGWVDDSNAGRSSVLTIVGNVIEQKGAAKAVDISLASAVIANNFFQVKAGETTGASMINVSGGNVMILNNRLRPLTIRTDIIDIGASSGNVISGNIIDGEATNAIHLAGSGDKNIVSNNNCDSETIRIASGSTGNVIALNRAQTITGSTTDNQIGLNITG